MMAPPAPAQTGKFTPGAANSVILIDVAALHNSPIGKANNWAAKHAEDYAAGAAPFPPSTQSLMFAREIEPGGLRTVRREVAVLHSVELITFQRLAEVIGGKTQMIGSRRVVASTRGFLATLLDDKSAAAYYPADRQAFSRWLRAAQPEREQLSPYLARAAANWPRSGQIVIALDMSEAVDESAIGDELNKRKDLGLTDANAKALAKAFATIEGMRFTVAANEKINAEWSVEFTEPIAGVERLMRPFLENAVKRIGDNTLDLSKWGMSLTTHAVTFRSTLSPEQFRGVLESIHSPILMGQALNRKGAADPAAAKLNLSYYRGVANILQALGRSANRLDDYNTAAMQYERAASRIQRMSAEKIEPELTAFANQAASMLMTMASMLRGVPRETAINETIAWNDRFYYGPSFVNPTWNYPWRWGLTEPVYTGPNITNIAKSNIDRSIADEAAKRSEDWLRIRELQRLTAASMTNKFGVDFTQAK